MKRLYKIALLILLPIICEAQSNYKPGYVVTPKGDTTRGFIDYQEWNTNPGSIRFKTTLNDKNNTVFTPENISFFNVSNLESYQSYSGSISMDQTDPNNISEGRDSSFRMAAVFLKVLQKGKRLTIYSYGDAIKIRYFMKESPDTEPSELSYRVYNTTINGNHKSVDENTWLKQLLALGQKYNVVDDAFQADIDHAAYNKEAILKITAKINGITNTQFDKQSSAAPGFDLFAGVALNVTNTKPEAEYQVAGGKSYTSLLPAVSFGINFYANPNTGKLVFRGEVMLSENSYKSNYINQSEPYIPLKYSYNQFAAAFVPQVIYNVYNAEDFKVYIDLGLALTLNKYYNAEFGSQDGKTPVSSIVSGFDPYYFSSYNTLVVFKAGVKINKTLGIFASYQAAASVSNDIYFRLSYTTIQAGVNYFFR